MYSNFSRVSHVQIPGLVNVDFADVKAVMKDSGTAMLGVGVSSSKNRAEEAAEQATLAPLIGSSIQSATGIVYNITGGKDITLQEVNRVSQVRVYRFHIFQSNALKCVFWITMLLTKLPCSLNFCLVNNLSLGRTGKFLYFTEVFAFLLLRKSYSPNTPLNDLSIIF